MATKKNTNVAPAKASAKKAPQVKAATKKTAQKTVLKSTKAVVAKKPAPKKKAEHVVRIQPRTLCGPCMFESPQDKAFWVNNGPVVSTLEGLREALKTMSDEQFAYHTKRAGNDFARWVDEVLCHGHCAKKLMKAPTRDHAVRAIASCNCG